MADAMLTEGNKQMSLGYFLCLKAMTIREWPCQVTCSLAGPGSAQQVQGWQRIDNMCLKHGHAANPEVLGKLENKQLLLEGKWY